MKKNLFILVATLSLAVASCQQVDMESSMKMQTMTQDEFAASLKLVDVSDRIAELKNTAITRSTLNLDTKLDPIDDFTIVICSWTWHRKRGGCNSGFGICDFKWFPDFKNIIDNGFYENTYEDGNDTDMSQCENSSLIEFDADGNPYMDVLLTHPIDIAIPDSISTLFIDEDVVSEEADASGRYFIMKKGSYPYNPAIGLNGGYHINMERK